VNELILKKHVMATATATAFGQKPGTKHFRIRLPAG
jgi:hypothetical protein